MALSAGDTLPDATFFVMTPDGPAQKSMSEVFGGRKVVAFAIPGAYTPTCHNKHLPGFVANAAAFRAKGVDAIVCITVNDPFVIGHWAKETGAGDAVEILGDGAAAFTTAVGMELDASAFGLGIRSQRYAMLVEDKVVKLIHVEDVPSSAEASTAEAILEAM